KNKPLKVPSEDSESVFEAATLFENKDSFDLFVAIFSSKPLTFDDFSTADEEINQDEKTKKFNKLIEFLNNKSFSALKVITRAR
ncbi:MAG: hypothetical protein QG567_1788, partial [Campylobacterota bacterium]|nr:hypothetical protein [Campylobacterota bacterium]